MDAGNGFSTGERDVSGGPRQSGVCLESDDPVEEEDLR
jgi:hypothetical protein